MNSKGFHLITLEEDFLKQQKPAVKTNIEFECEKCSMILPYVYNVTFSRVIAPDFCCKICKKLEGKAEYYNLFEDMLNNEGYDMVTSLDAFLMDAKETRFIVVKIADRNGNFFTSSYNRFQQGHRSKKEADDKKRVGVEEAKRRFMEKGFIPLFEEYHEEQEYLQYICYCGRENEMRLSNLSKNKKGCMTCARKSRKIPESTVLACFDRAGCIPHFEQGSYLNNATPINFTCFCGREGSTSYKSFKNGTRCPWCTEEKRKATNIKIYGSANFFASEEGKRKIREHWLKVVPGATHSSHIPEIIAARQATHMKKRNVKSNLCLPETRKLGEEAMIKLYGVDQFMKSPKFREAMLRTYGVEHAMQNQGLFAKMQKSSFNTKRYVFPSGRIEEVRGYEPQRLDEMLKDGIPEEDIVVNQKEMPVIRFHRPDNRYGYYHPDIFIPKDNVVIEVKSTYTFLVDKQVNLCKWKKASKKYEFQVYIYGKVIRKIPQLDQYRKYQGGRLIEKIKYQNDDVVLRK